MFVTIDSMHFRLWLKASTSELLNMSEKKQLCHYSGAFNGGQIISIKNIEFAKRDNTLISFQLTLSPAPPLPFLQIEPVMSVEMQTMQTPDCRLQTVQTVQTVQTECYFFYLYLNFLVKFLL